MLGVQDQFVQELTVSQQVNLIPGAAIDSPQMWAWFLLERSLKIQKLAASFKLRVLVLIKTFQRLLGQSDVASSVVSLGFLHVQPLLFWHMACVPSNLRWLSLRMDHSCVNMCDGSPGSVPGRARNGIDTSKAWK